jgi:ligand-binding sensor domain-containing protein
LLFKTIVLFTLVSLNLAVYLHARPADIKFEHITPKHGLAQVIVGAILQDSRGFMWFGTRGGLIDTMVISSTFMRPTRIRSMEGKTNIYERKQEEQEKTDG